jgi:hypothetical protein
MFTYNIQLAGYDYSKYDEKGEVDIQGFIKAIEQFPWMEQLEKYNQIQQGCSATISVTNLNTNNALWISIAGNRDNYNYLIGYVYPKATKGFLGLGKEKIKRWIDIYNVDDFVLIKNYFSVFFNGDEALLQEQLSQEEKFQSMVAKEN